MRKNEFLALARDRILLLDGATGTELHKAGMPHGESPELWVLKNPQALEEIQSKYVRAGSRIIYTCSFGASQFKLAEFGFRGSCSDVNRKLAEISRKAAGREVLVAGCVGPTGIFIEPFGQLPFEKAVAAFRTQIMGLIDGGCDLIVIETMMDIQEARAALIAAKELSDTAVMVSMTFTGDGRTLTGTPPSAAVVTLQSLGAAAIGCNCSSGPDAMLGIISEMAGVSEIPLVAKPNAGLPKLVEGETVFDMPPAKFASFGPAFVKAGCGIIGGCCGTDPIFIAELGKKLKGLAAPSPSPSPACSFLSSARKTVEIGPGNPVIVVGERINPTGKQVLKDELRTGVFKELRRLALEQKERNADILDVNVGSSGVDEKKILPEAVSTLSSLVDIPLCLDSSDIAAMEKALRTYPGRALINSISFEREKIRKLLPAAAKYGAMFIALPIGDRDIPETAAGRRRYVEKILKAARKLGLKDRDAVVDGLVMTVSSNQSAARETLKLIEWASEKSLSTIVGLSNVSFGLPERKWINSAFLAMATDRGLTCAIMNPSSEECGSAVLASDVLALRDKGCTRYVAKFGAGAAPTIKETFKGEQPRQDIGHLIYDAVLKGDRVHIRQFIEDGLACGLEPRKIVNEFLIPAIGKVGDLFDRKEYYLPQLIMSADTMKISFDILEPHLVEPKAGSAGEGRTSVILATVKGDIHDIGKNIVALMMRNYGFDVIDLGKDVGHGKIIECVRSSGARIVGLSALMTTTMANMREIVRECRKAFPGKLKFIVGGAVLDQGFADEIGADGYAADAVGAVKVVRKWAGK